MAKQPCVSRKEVLNQPDPSEIFAMRVSVAIDWAKENLRYMMYGVLGIVVIAIVVIAWTSWQGYRREQASLLLHQALKLVDEDADTKAAAPEQAIEKLQVITKKYGRTPAGALAFWHLGHLHFKRGEMAEALRAYQVARRRLPNRQPLSSTLAILNMGYAQEATDDCGEAIASYESVQQSPIRWLHGEAYIGMGRCHEKAGAREKAIEVYDRALADVYVTGVAQQTISERLARLQPEEPVTPSETPAEPPSPATSSETSEDGEEKNASEEAGAEPDKTEPDADKTEPENVSVPAETTTTSQAGEPADASQSSSATETTETAAPEVVKEEAVKEEAEKEEAENKASDTTEPAKTQ